MRNVLYENRYMVCNVEVKDDNKTKSYQMDGKGIYVGETSRSIYERTQEHKNDIEALKSSSHVLRHLLDRHENDSWREVEFGAKVLEYTRSSLRDNCWSQCSSRKTETIIS